MASDRGSLQRKMAAIVHADVAGSTTLVQRDETLAHERINNAFNRFNQIIEQYGGKVNEVRGDALVAEFPRASDAACAALAFQQSHNQILEQLGDDIVPKIRIGVSLGEVIIADGQVTGAGVVLAQRVEQLAEPGGLCITAAIHEALPQHMPFDQYDLGEQEVKGFEEAVRVYRVALKPGKIVPLPEHAGELKSINTLGISAAIAVAVLLIAGGVAFWFQLGQPEEEPASEEQIAFPRSDKPSIAVLPFTNMSDDPEQEYFSDGVTEDIITDLSQLNNLAVIARNSSFTYKNTAAKAQDIGKDLGAKFLVEGSVRKAGDRIRVTAQLIDTGSGHHLWAERYDRELVDLFSVQDEITKEIVSALSIQLSGDERQQLAYRATGSVEAYDLFLQAQRIGVSFTAETLGQAVDLYEQAISIDPEFARAYGALAVVLTRQYIAGFSDSPAETKARSLELARKAESMAPDSPQVLWSLGYVYMYADQIDSAIKAVERAVRLAPSYADGHALLGLIKNNLGQFKEAIGLIEKGMKLNPFYTWDYLYNLGRAHYALGDYEKAVLYLEQALERNESPSQPRLYLAASYVQLGQREDAEWEITELEISFPEITISHMQRLLPLRDEELRDRLISDLRAAGLSE